MWKNEKELSFINLVIEYFAELTSRNGFFFSVFNSVTQILFAKIPKGILYSKDEYFAH